VDFSNLLKFIVEDEGYEGLQFPLGDADIVAWAEEHKPAVILMDLALRRKGGSSTLTICRRTRRRRDTHHHHLRRELMQKEILEFQVRGIRYLRKGRVEVQEIKDENPEGDHGRQPLSSTLEGSQAMTVPLSVNRSEGFLPVRFRSSRRTGLPQHFSRVEWSEPPEGPPRSP